jgi:protein-S-isoprenylcysteine O-methyltransferase Ste14
MNSGFVKAIIILPGTALVYIPGLIVWLSRGTSYAAAFPPASALAWLVGSLLTIAGLILACWTMQLFQQKGGGGTPAPWEPVKNLIIAGPYRYVRNPMLLGVILLLIAEALWLQSLPILLWMIAFVVLNTVYFALSEEPQLEKRFGKAYTDYKTNVPRWLPRLSPYRASTEERLGPNA